MNTNRERRSGRWLLFGLGILGLAVAALVVMTVKDSGSNTASAASGGAAMSLEVNGQTGKVTLPLNSTFDVIAKADAIPLANGYDAALAWIEFGNTGLTFISSATGWPDCDTNIEFSANTATGANRGCLTGVTPAVQFGSVHKGALYSFTLTCSSSHTINQIDLVPANQPPADTSGAQFREHSTNNQIIPAVSGIEVNCGPKPTATPTITLTPTITPTPTPKPPDGDTDGDGIPNSSDPNDDNDACTDVQENGPDETLGGRRNPHNAWDFYDTNGDAFIDLTNDIFEVIQHYAPMGIEQEYDVNFDRGPSSGPNAWNMTAPDGVIDLTNDILGVILQYFHSCQ